MQRKTSGSSVGSAFLSLRAEEVSATLEAAELLRKQSWAQSLLAKFEREGGCSKANMPTMFEVRYGRALHDCGITPTYEQRTGVGKTSVDFGVKTAVQWLVELYSLAETEVAITATWCQGSFFGRSLQSPRRIGPNENLASEEIQRRREEQKISVEGETLQTIERILSKVSDGKVPLKFPAPTAHTYTLLCVDDRTLLGGRADRRRPSPNRLWSERCTPRT